MRYVHEDVVDCDDWQAFRAQAEALAAKDADIARLREAAQSALRAADLALFVIRKQGVMPNSSWQAGFERDTEAARQALGASHDA
jgi:hypothetical protein